MPCSTDTPKNLTLVVMCKIIKIFFGDTKWYLKFKVMILYDFVDFIAIF